MNHHNDGSLCAPPTLEPLPPKSDTEKLADAISAEADQLQALMIQVMQAAAPRTAWSALRAAGELLEATNNARNAATHLYQARD